MENESKYVNILQNCSGTILSFIIPPTYMTALNIRYIGKRDAPIYTEPQKKRRTKKLQFSILITFIQ